MVLADNTDLPGAVAAVRERYDGPVTAGTVLGGGATAASTGLALCELGARSVTLLVRSPERAAEAVAALRRHPSRPAGRGRLAGRRPGGGRGRGLHGAGRGAGRPPARPVRRRAGGLRGALRPVADPAGRRDGRVPDQVLVGGLDLLVHQAALQFALFTGRPAPLEEMRRAGERALAGR